MSDVMPSKPAAGWYEDHGRQRWWDGVQWTNHYAPPPQYATPVIVQRAPSNGAAIASMVLGIVGFAISLTVILVIIAIPMALIGLILGIVGLSKARQLGGTGRGQAITGIILCAAPFVFWIVGSFMTGFTSGVTGGS